MKSAICRRILGAGAPENPCGARVFIEVAWSRGRLDTVNKMYGYKVFDAMDKPTNGEFISCVSEKIKGAKSAAV